MSCKTIADLIPESYLKFPKIADLIKKIPKIPGIKKKNWKIKVPMQKAIAFLSNPANQALIKTVMDIKNLGDLANLTTLMNIARFAQVNGMVDLSKLQGAAKNAMDALDCINKNIAAVENIGGQLQSELQQLLNTGTSLQAVGLDQVLGQLGITDIMGVTPALQEQLNSVLKFQKLTEIPGVGATLPLPWDAPKYQQSLYILNSMAAMIQTVDLGERDTQMGKALTTTSQAAGIYSNSSALLNTLSVPLVGALGEISPQAFPGSSQSSVESAALGGVTREVLEKHFSEEAPQGGFLSGGIPSKDAIQGVLNNPPKVTQADGGISPISPETITALASAGNSSMDNLRESLSESHITLSSFGERTAWKKRQLGLLKQRYIQDYDAYKKVLMGVTSVVTEIPDGVDKNDLVLLSKRLSLRASEPLEDFRIIDYKLKAVDLELSELGKDEGLIKDSSEQFNAWGAICENLVYPSGDTMSWETFSGSANPPPAPEGDISVVRKWFTEESTIGVLTFGSFTCYTLEDKVRAPGVKVYKETAIPQGRYKVNVSMSPKFGKPMPRLLNVPMFDGILIHSGTKAAHTWGCILVGSSKGKDTIGGKETFSRLFPLIDEAQKKRTLHITIRNSPETDSRKR